MLLQNANGRRLNLSVSALDTWNDCRRKWWYAYYLRLPQAETDSLLVGNAVHDTAENYLSAGVVPDSPNRWWGILEPGLEFLPLAHAPGAGMPGASVEEWLGGHQDPRPVMCGPLPLSGKVDFWYAIPLEGDDYALVIGDWKTTKARDWRWSKTPRQLALLVQPNLYAKVLADKHFGGRPPSQLFYQHINLLTEGAPGAMEVWAKEPSWDTVLEVWADAEAAAAEMAELVRAAPNDPVDVPFDARACRKFGGCPFAATCPASPKNRDTYVPFKGLDALPATTRRDTVPKPPALAALHEKLGINPKSAPAPAPESAPEPAPRQPDSVRIEACAKALAPMLAALGAISAAAMESTVTAQGLGVPAVAQHMGVKLDVERGAYVPASRPTTAPLHEAPALKSAPAQPAAQDFKDQAAVDALLAQGADLQDMDACKEVIKSALGRQRMGNRQLAAIVQEAQARALTHNPPPVADDGEQGACAAIVSADPDGPVFVHAAGNEADPDAREGWGVMPLSTFVLVDTLLDGGAATTSMDEVMAPHYAHVEQEYRVPHWSVVKYKEAGFDAIGLLAQALDRGAQLPSFISVSSRHGLADLFVEVLARRPGVAVLRGVR